VGRIAEEEKLDALELWREKFTEARVAYMAALEEAMRTGEINVNEAISQFAANMKWPREQASQYLNLMADSNSRFKVLK